MTLVAHAAACMKLAGMSKWQGLLHSLTIYLIQPCCGRGGGALARAAYCMVCMGVNLGPSRARRQSSEDGFCSAMIISSAMLIIAGNAMPIVAAVIAWQHHTVDGKGRS